MNELSTPPRACFMKRILSMYVEGFRSMTVGRKLWLIILIKLAIIFLVLKLFFFNDTLSSRYQTDEQRAAAVRNSLINR